MDHSCNGFSGVPVIETARLRLRGHTVEDAEKLTTLWRDEDVTRYIGGKPQTAEESWGRLLRYAGHWRLLGFGYWVLEEKATGEFVGEAGLSEYKREIVPPLDSVAEAGWVLAASKHGMGLATEAVQAVLGWGREHFGVLPVTCMIHPENRASIRVAEKCGFTQREVGMYKGNATLIFERKF
ncbi:MAG: GNAT family N-acetyltransferase [Terracidiphilus sp.]|jgi:RimJ/RimL family protein N-acetyltransferase